MELIRNRWGLGLVAGIALFLAAACELDSGNGDAGDMGGGDVPPQCVADDYCDTSCASDPDCTTPRCVADDYCDTSCASDPDCAPECVADDFCDTSCAADPDCPCACDRADNRCDITIDLTDPDNAGSSETACSCDPDCTGGDTGCDGGDTCDPYCGARDGDCPCGCDYYDGICEPSKDHALVTDVCTCDDDDCSGTHKPCEPDGHCDTFCDPPNTSGTTEYICTDQDCGTPRDDGSCRR